MKNIIYALIAAFKSLFHPKMFSLILWPMLSAMVLWMGAAFLYWDSWAANLMWLIQATLLEQWLTQGFLESVSHYLVNIILVFLLLTAIYMTALFITSVFSMPIMVNHVAQKYYPALETRKGGTTFGGIANTMIAIFVYCVGWVLTLPLWIFTPFAIVLPVILMAYLNQRLFSYDALSLHAGRKEYERFMKRNKASLFVLGALAGLMQFVPVLNLFAPVYTGLAFIHLCLAELQQHRQA